MYFQNSSYSGLSTKFEKFRQKIELTQNQRDKIKTSHKHLREKILQPLDYISHTFLTGSYKKKTLINPANDIDVFIVLSGYTQYNIKPNTILDKLKKDLQKTYPNTIIKQDKPCVVIEFNHVTFELTPAIEIENYQIHNPFYIPEMSKNNTWQLIENPRVLEEKLTEANKRLNQKLNPLIKMMKKCKIHNNINTPSFEMEKMAINSLYYINGFRDGIQQLLRVYQWEHNKYTYYDIENMSDNEFATFCRNSLFGYDFPKD
jgi:predicted nucleotidyltransferase